jgi:4a-hydroxytetrahydrobiopterin dehydratase
MPLTPQDIAARLTSTPGWKVEHNALVREFSFPAFPDAVAFVARLAFDAEAADHHPDLLVKYKRVTVTWSTHDEGGVTEKDFAGVRQADAVAARFGHRG